MKEHYLMRSFGKRRWTISGHDSVEEATKAAHAYIASGHIFSEGTRLYVESNIHIGFVQGNTIVGTMPMFEVKHLITGHDDHKIHL